ncbi:MAG: hypothetical protein GF334_10590 [Candidatus Altiarchaeales archaeon]|nr:hypothetical protein [Candidatus Altiarchaeales archaeon]
MTESEDFLRQRVAQLEAENKALKVQLQNTEQGLADLQEERIRAVDPRGEIEAISLQQIQALTGHLLRLRQKNQQLLKQIQLAEKAIAEKNRELKAQKEHQKPKQKTELDLEALFEADDRELKKTLFGGGGMKVSLEFKDFISFLSRHKRVKIADAALLLDVDRSRVKKWVDFLRSMDFISGGVEIHSTVVAKPKLNLLLRKLG